jgi:hypothetical protein
LRDHQAKVVFETKGGAKVNRGNRIYSLPLIIVLLASFACARRYTADINPCCLDISVNRILDSPPLIEGPQDGEVRVVQRFDKTSIVATLAGPSWKTVRYYSDDEGVSWRYDQFYQKLGATHALREGDILPWDPNPVDPKVQYRTIYRKMLESFHERSTDGGKTWVRMKGAIIDSNAEMDRGGSVFYHPRDRLTLYAVSSLPGWNYEKGMFVSLDGGDNFKFMYYSSRIASALAISQSNPNVLFGAGPMGSLLKSIDGGATWDFVGQNDQIRKTHIRKPPADRKSAEKSFDTSTTNVWDIVIDPENERRVYVVSSKGLLRTEDGGETWCILNTGISKADGINTVAIAPQKPEVILIGTYRGLFRSPDRGCHWDRVDVLSRAVQ